MIRQGFMFLALFLGIFAVMHLIPEMDLITSISCAVIFFIVSLLVFYAIESESFGSAQENLVE
ncbi:hypothetical protein [Ectobacillus panaciterrae]|uniref:hypothetical protein n=1 Tax=Ectobacillus panaciterrae TaxID=363872 RepID=UPI0004142802|nr:hypothetical protein [Ectobacillus panaciterrae]